jgi:hypothetical protein
MTTSEAVEWKVIHCVLASRAYAERAFRAFGREDFRCPVARAVFEELRRFNPEKQAHAELRATAGWLATYGIYVVNGQNFADAIHEAMRKQVLHGKIMQAYPSLTADEFLAFVEKLARVPGDPDVLPIKKTS